MKLTEKQLRHIVNECVNRVVCEQYLNESVDETIGSWFKGKLQNAGNAIKNVASTAGTAVGNAAKTAGNAVKNSVDILAQSGLAAIGAKFIGGVKVAMKADPNNQQLQQCGQQLLTAYKQFVTAATKGNVNQIRQNAQQNMNNTRQTAQNNSQNYQQNKVNTGSFSDNAWQSVGNALNYANTRAQQANQNLATR